MSTCGNMFISKYLNISYYVRVISAHDSTCMCQVSVWPSSVLPHLATVYWGERRGGGKRGEGSGGRGGKGTVRRWRERKGREVEGGEKQGGDWRGRAGKGMGRG